MGINCIFVIVDPTSDAQPAYERALDAASETGAALRLYACLDPEVNGRTGHRSSLHDLMRGLVERAVARGIASKIGVSVEQVHTQKGKVVEAIRDVAVDIKADLIVVGTVARDGIKGRVIGNTCERLLDQTHADVLVLN